VFVVLAGLDGGYLQRRSTETVKRRCAAAGSRAVVLLVGMQGEVGVVGHGVGLVGVVQIVTSGMAEPRGDGCDEDGGGALFDGRVGEDAGNLGDVAIPAPGW